MTGRKLALIAAALPLSALANMGMPMPVVAGALFTRYWFAYVVVTIVWEALALGWWFHVRPPVAIRVALWANTASAAAGICPCWCVIPGAWGGVANSWPVNPDPLGALVGLLLLTGATSALIEALVWRLFLRREQTPVRTGRLVVGLLGVHLIGVPIALAILLLPAHPYTYTQELINQHRPEMLRMDLWEYVREHGALPSGTTWEEFARNLPGTYHAYDPDTWSLGYRAEYRRFDRGEMRRHPIDFNAGCSGITQADLGDRTVWIVRWPEGSGWHGIVFTGGWPRQSADPTALGLAKDGLHAPDGSR